MQIFGRFVCVKLFSCFLDSALSDIILFGFVVLVRGWVMSGCPHFEKCWILVFLKVKIMISFFFPLKWMCGNSASSLRRIPKKKSFNHGTWMLVTKTRLPHHREPNEFVFGPTSFGVLSWRLDADNYETDEELKKIREERGYSCVVCHLNSACLYKCAAIVLTSLSCYSFYSKAAVYQLP